MMGRPSCIQCIYYYVTHDPQQPYGCRSMGFKSTQNPAVMVFSSSGVECQLFQQKQKNIIIKSKNGTGGLVA